jgi:hypothetical protein
MLDLLFVFFFLISTSWKDIWTMTKVELIYWGYNPSRVSSYNPGNTSGNNYGASEAASVGQFLLMYFYAFAAAFVLYTTGIYTWQTCVYSLSALIWLHWTGVEDLGYYLLERWFKNPQEYDETHPFYTIVGFHIPKNLSHLSRPRKVWFITIPSIIGFVCGQDVPGKKFLAFTLLNIVLVIIVSFILR